MNAETKITWFQAGSVFGAIVTTLLFYIYFMTPKPKADSRPLEDSEKQADYEAGYPTKDIHLVARKNKAG